MKTQKRAMKFIGGRGRYYAKRALGEVGLADEVRNISREIFRTLRSGNWDPAHREAVAVWVAAQVVWVAAQARHLREIKAAEIKAAEIKAAESNRTAAANE